MVTIYGYTDVVIFSSDIEKAKKKAVKIKKQLCKYDLDKWSWKTVTDYYGTSIEQIKEGTIFIEGIKQNDRM